MRQIVPESRYVARPEQVVFHRSQARIRFLRGGVGGGKTIAGAAEALWLAAENKGCDGMIVAPHWSTLQRVTLREVLRLMPKNRLRQHFKQERYLELINGARIYYGSADQPETLEGSNLAWAWGDEARYWKREAWQILIARVRDPKARRLGIVITSTPSMGWLYEEFGADRPDAASFVMPTATNPYLPPGYLDALKRRYSPALFRQYCEGQWVQLEGACFEDFDPAKQIQDLTVVPGEPVHWGVDFGYRRPAAIALQHLPRCNRHGAADCIHLLDEIMPDNTPTPRLAEAIGETTRRRGWKLGTCYCDPAGSASSQEAGYSSIDIMESAGLRCEFTRQPESTYIPNGIEAVRAKILDATGRCSLYLDSSLAQEGHERGIVKSLQLSAYPPLTDGKPVSDKPVKDGLYDHALDALRYAIINLFPPVAGTIRTPW